jgi:hypothetical protein
MSRISSLDAVYQFFEKIKELLDTSNRSTLLPLVSSLRHKMHLMDEIMEMALDVL